VWELGFATPDSELWLRPEDQERFVETGNESIWASHRWEQMMKQTQQRKLFALPLDILEVLRVHFKSGATDFRTLEQRPKEWLDAQATNWMHQNGPPEFYTRDGLGLYHFMTYPTPEVPSAIDYDATVEYGVIVDVATSSVSEWTFVNDMGVITGFDAPLTMNSEYGILIPNEIEDTFIQVVHTRGHVEVSADADLFEIPRAYQRGIMYHVVYSLLRRDTKFKNTLKSQMALSMYKSVRRKLEGAKIASTERMVMRGAPGTARKRRDRHPRLPSNYPSVR